MMRKKGVRCGAGLLALLFSSALVASEPLCVTATFYDVDTSFENAVREQLRNELGDIVVDSQSEGTCRRLIIEMQGDTARVSLVDDRVIETTLDFDEVAPLLRARAVALSAAGLLMLSQNPGQSDANPAAEKQKANEPDGAATDENRSKTETTPDVPKTDSKNAVVLPKKDKTPGRLHLHLLAGARLIPKFWVGVGELVPGIGVPIGAFCLDISLVGLLGRKSVDIGRIYTAGIGLRLTGWRQALRKKAFTLRIGPSVEIIGVFGYGRQADGATTHTEFAPVVDVLLLLGGRLALSPQLDAAITLGGGWTVLYFQMQADNKKVSGLAGGIASLAVGINFGAKK